MKKPGRQLIGAASTIALLLLLFFSWSRGNLKTPVSGRAAERPSLQATNAAAAQGSPTLQRFNAATTPPSGPISAFYAWAENYAAATPAAKAALQTEGEALAR